MTQFTPPPFQILPPIIKNLIIINVLIFLAKLTIDKSGVFSMEDVFGLHHVKSPLFEPWQIITHLFMHGNWGHIFFNMLALWMFGSVLENLWGGKKFITFYFICGIGASLLHLTFLWFNYQDMVNQMMAIKQHATPENVALFFQKFSLADYKGASGVLSSYVTEPNNLMAKTTAISWVNDYTLLRLNTPTVGASGAIAGILAAFLYLFPNTEIYLYFLIPVRAKWLGVIYFGQELYFAITNSEGDNVAHWAHLGGALVGFLLVLTWNKNRRSFN